MIETLYSLTVPASILVALLTRKDLAVVSSCVIFASELIFRMTESAYSIMLGWAILNVLLVILSVQHYKKTQCRLSIVVGWFGVAGVFNILVSSIFLNNPAVIGITYHAGGIMTILLLIALVFMDGRKGFALDVDRTVHRSRAAYSSLRHRRSHH